MTYKNCGDIPAQIDICDQTGIPQGDLCYVESYESMYSRGSDRTVWSPLNTEETIELVFFLKGTMDECVARARVEDQNIGLPPEYNGQPLQRYALRIIGWNVFECRAQYGYRGTTGTIAQPPTTPPASQVLPTQISFSTGGGRVKLTQSLKTENSYPSDVMNNDDNKPPSFNKAILYDGERVNGLDVIASSLRYTETWIMRADLVFSAPTTNKGTFTSMLDLWTDYTGAVHNYRSPDTGADPDPNAPDAPLTYGFRNWGQGEVLFVGAQMRQVGSIHYEVTYDFQISPNKTFLLPETIDKRATRQYVNEFGWDYVWFYYGEQSQEAGTGGANPYNVNAPLPKFAFTEQVYKDRDFANLQVGYKAFDPTVVNLIGCTCGDAEYGSYMPGHPEDWCYPP